MNMANCRESDANEEEREKLLKFLIGISRSPLIYNNE